MRQIDLVRATSARFDDALERALATAEGGRKQGTSEDLDVSLEALRGRQPVAGLASPAAKQAYGTIEAIILAELRPAYRIENDRIVVDGAYDHLDVLEANRPALEAVAINVGRVDLLRHPTLSYAGTGWLIDDDVVVTNRHVAEAFAEPAFDGHTFARGIFDEPMEARLDTVRQKDAGEVGPRVAAVTDILYVAAPREPDIAFLRIAPRPDLRALELSEVPAEPGLPIAAIGYPARDGGRNDPALMERLFGGVYGVKRLSPGLLNRLGDENIVLLGDYTSLGGNSGSAVVDLATGRVVGLHFAGVFRDTNRAVAADVVAAARRRLRTRVQGRTFEEETLAPTPAAAFAGRDGYDPHFLGDGALSVPLPALGARAADLAPVEGDDNDRLRYTHFTVLQSRSRRLPMLTAVNIDGARAFRLKRRGSWRLDGRLDDDHQIGNVLYRHNPLDRGHMVRRRDPGWGESREEAERAEVDTFHYTNCAPQHEDLNQRDWVGLEDYILEAAETRDFKVSVFTGPVFRTTDRRLRDQPGAEDIAIPEEFWKVAVMVNAATGALSATGYVLSHGPLIRDMTEAAFVFGAYGTYQVRITRIEAATGFDFGRLREADPLAAEPEIAFGRAAFRIDGPQSLRLGPSIR